MSSLLFGNATDIVHWQPNCNTRGTFDILSTCIITLLLCVWTAVHLNVSPPGDDWESRFRKVGWLFLALLAPELVAYTAWDQRQKALFIMWKVNKTFALPKPPPWYDTAVKGIAKTVTRLKRATMLPSQEPQRQPTLEAQKDTLRKDRHSWTMAHGFYAIMGGLAIQIPENLPDSERFLPSDHSETWFLTNGGVLYLMEHETTHADLPDLSKEEIKSKSKANGLAKALVCIQALWFIAQCITRLAQRIPISLLELNTFGHALCAVLIYVLWWEKPFEVDYPTIIQSQTLWDYRALDVMYMNPSSATKLINRELRARVEGDKRFQALKTQRYFSTQYETLRLLSLLEYPSVESEMIMCKGCHNESCIGNDEGAHRQKSDLFGNEEVTSIILKPGQSLQGTGFQILRPGDLYDRKNPVVFYFGIKLLELSPELRKAFDELGSTLPDVNLTARDVTRWKRAWRACQSATRRNPGEAQVLSDPFPEKLLARRCSDWIGWSDIFHIPTLLSFTAATFVYGGLHALAWSAHFDSATEKLLWRISSCVVMAGLPVGFALLKYGNRVVFYSAGTPAVRFMCNLILVAYVLARAYLVVECFINIFHLPAGVYATPKWSTYFPHIS